MSKLKISLLWHFRHFGPDNSLMWLAVLCIKVCLAASMASAHYMPIAWTCSIFSLSSDFTFMLSMFLDCVSENSEPRDGSRIVSTKIEKWTVYFAPQLCLVYTRLFWSLPAQLNLCPYCPSFNFCVWLVTPNTYFELRNQQMVMVPGLPSQIRFEFW